MMKRDAAARPVPRALLAAAVGVALGVVATDGAALPAVGRASADGQVEDVDGKVLRISSLRGRAVVVVYEDKASKGANAAFKADLTRILREAPLQAAVVVAPVADVSEYNSWPAKGFVKDAIRDESKKTGATIWCDWDASFRKVLDLSRGQSNVVVLGRDGEIRFAAAGTLSASQRAAVEAILRGESAPR